MGKRHSGYGDAGDGKGGHSGLKESIILHPTIQISTYCREQIMLWSLLLVLQLGMLDSLAVVLTVRIDDGDDAAKNCECPQKPSIYLTQMSDRHPYNVRAGIPKDLYMKHAGWDSHYRMQVGNFHYSCFQKGEKIGAPPVHFW